MTALIRRREFWLEWLCLVPLVMVMATAGLLFGGVAWWFRPLAVMGLSLAVAGGLLRVGFQRGKLFLRSPMLLIGIIGCGWAVFQLVPLPRSIVGSMAPLSLQVYGYGNAPVPEVAPSTTLPDAPQVANSRIPISLNRSEGVRRILILLMGLPVFWFVGLWTDRLPKLMTLVSLLVALGMVNSAIMTLQLLDGSSGLWGLFQPDHRLVVGPGWVDLQAAPHLSNLEFVGAGNSSDQPWPIARPQALGLVGIMPGGLASFTCLQSVVIPLMFGCLCYLSQRRGSRFGFVDRLRDRGMTALWIVLVWSLFLSTLILGSIGQLLPLVPAFAGLFMAFIWALRADLEKKISIALVLISVAGASAGLWNSDIRGIHDQHGIDSIWADRPVFDAFASDAFSIWESSGWTGIGLGAYSHVSSYWKHTYASPSNSISSLAQSLIEFGVPALGLMACGSLWVFWKSIKGFRHVDAEHRCLLGTILGASFGVMVGLCLLPGWELPILTLVACTILGLADRCLCGARDLFVESWEGV